MESHLRLVVGLVLELLHDLEELRDHVPVNLRRVLPLPRLRFGLGSCAPLLLGLRLNWRRNCRNFSLLRSLLRVLALGCSLGGCLVVSLSWSALGFRLWLLLLLLVVLCFLPCSLLSLLLLPAQRAASDGSLPLPQQQVLPGMPLPLPLQDKEQRWEAAGKKHPADHQLQAKAASPTCLQENLR